MAINFEEWNKQFGGEETRKALEDAAKNEYSEVPDGTYKCRLEKLELGESQKGQPMIKGQFRITEGEHKKQCIFYNQVFCRSASGSAFPIHKGVEFLRSLQIFDDAEVGFTGDYAEFNDLLLDMAEEAESNFMTFGIKKSHDGDYTRLDVTEVYE